MSAPTEFRYRERQHTVKARLARSLGRSVLGFDPAPDDAWVDAFEAACRRGDPLAEAFVRSQGKGGLRASRRALELALAQERAWLKGSGTAGEDGRALCQSYVEAFARRDDEGALAWLEEGLHRGMTRLFVPSGVYREQALPPAGLWPLLPLVPFPLVFGAETLRRRWPALDSIADRVARAERRAWLTRHTQGRAATFQP